MYYTVRSDKPLRNPNTGARPKFKTDMPQTDMSCTEPEHHGDRPPKGRDATRLVGGNFDLKTGLIVDYTYGMVAGQTSVGEFYWVGQA